jgi:hypothetical protein
LADAVDVIIDMEAAPARTYDEVAATKTMIKRTERQFDLKPDRLAADTAYGTGKFLGWLVDTGITPHIPVWENGKREDGTFSRSDFTFDKDKNEYTCPAGKVLRTTGRVHDGGMIRYRASKFDCDLCPLKPKCCPNMPARQVPRDVHEEARDCARALMGTKGTEFRCSSPMAAMRRQMIPRTRSISFPHLLAEHRTQISPYVTDTQRLPR